MMMTRSAMMAVAAGVGLCLATHATSSHAQGGATGSAAARPDTSFSNVRADARARAQLDSVRRDILRLATFAGFASSPCGGIDMRTFDRDTSGTRVPSLLGRLELMVLTHGVSAPLANETGRSLLRAIVRLEAGGPGPRWDVLTGTPPRSFNPLLPTSLYDPKEKKCVMTPGEDPDALILPLAAGFVVPADSGTATVHVRHDAAGANEIRNMFYARFASDTTAVLRLTRVNAYAMWGDYAVVSVVRERLARGITPLPKATTGTVYALHRVGREWRLLAVVRTW